MASIGSAGGTAQVSLKELDREIMVIKDEIAAILAKKGAKDVRDFSVEDKEILRKKYEKITKLCKKRAKNSIETDEQAKYEDYATKFAKKAIQFGSNQSASRPTTTFDDVKGLEDAKKLVKSFVYMMQNHDIIDYYHLSGGLGMLMYGCPGTGKTMFAEAVAHELNLPLYIITPAEIFKPHVGESEEAVKKIFDAMDEEEDGCVLFVDECESIFSARSADTQDYKAAVTTELLQRINGFGDDPSKRGTSRIMIAATNMPELIDKAYLRYKRFSHIVHIMPPDVVAKKAIVEKKLKGIALEGITIDDIVDMTEAETTKMDPSGIKTIRTAYYSAANICGLIEEACRIAIEEIELEGSHQPKPLTRRMFETAFKKIRPGITAADLQKYIDFGKTDD